MVFRFTVKRNQKIYNGNQKLIGCVASSGSHAPYFMLLISSVLRDSQTYKRAFFNSVTKLGGGWNTSNEHVPHKFYPIDIHRVARHLMSSFVKKSSTKASRFGVAWNEIRTNSIMKRANSKLKHFVSVPVTRPFLRIWKSIRPIVQY